MANISIVLVIFVFFLYLVFLYLKSIVDNFKRNEKKRGFTKVAIGLILIVVLFIINNYYGKNRITIPLNSNVKNYIIKLNEVKKAEDGTSIKLNKAFLDINYSSFNIGIRGKSKLVAVELKRNLEDEKPLKALSGLWVGKSFTYDYSSIGVSYKAEGFIDPLYLVCYLSNGEEVSYKLEDEKNVKNNTEFIHINKVIEVEGKKLNIENVIFALNSMQLAITTDTGSIDFKAFISKDGKEYKEIKGSWAGGGAHYNYDFYTEPMKASELTLKILINGNSKEYLIKIK